MLSTKKLVLCSLIAAVYAAVTVSLAPFSYGQLQFRVSEAFTILPFISPYTMWGLFIGCFIANLFSPAVNIFDVLFGSLATLLAGFWTSKIKSRWLAPLPPVIVNGIVIGAILAYAASPDHFLSAFAIIGLQIAVEELVVCYALGIPLIFAFEHYHFKNYLD